MEEDRRRSRDGREGERPLRVKYLEE